MDNVLISLIISGIIILVLAAINAFLLLRFNKIHKNIKELLEKGQIQDYKEIFFKIKSLEDICKTTIQRVGVVRFNPFNEMGGNQSFVITMLDAKNNGFVISSLFVNDGNRIYAKIIKQGKSEQSLSKEEVSAIEKAVNQK